jgi:hypothetical protein
MRAQPVSLSSTAQLRPVSAAISRSDGDVAARIVRPSSAFIIDDGHPDGFRGRLRSLHAATTAVNFAPTVSVAALLDS